MNLLCPTFKLRLLPRMLFISFLGALLGGVYGVLHDQITYSISNEYYTKLKFDQFSFANFGFPVRIFVSEVGFLATWWVGFFSAWFLARIAVPTWPRGLALRQCLIAFSIIITFIFIAAVIGYFLGIYHSDDYSYWFDFCETLGVKDMPNFVRVAYIHNANYIGGMIGLICAILFLLRLKKIQQDATSSPPPLGECRHYKGEACPIRGCTLGNTRV